MGMLRFHIKGVVPTMMHNGQLADPLNEIAKQMKVLTSRGKDMTDDDRMEVARLEFMGSLYVNGDGAPCWPAENIEAMIRTAARGEKKGKEVERGVTVLDSAPLIYDGPKTTEKLWKTNGKHGAPIFVDRRGACPSTRGGRTTVMRTRPIFPVWELVFDVMFDSSCVNEDQVVRWVTVAGKKIGLSDYRPRYGRFEVTKTEVLETEAA